MKIKNGGFIKDKYVNNEYSQMIKNIIDKISENLWYSAADLVKQTSC